MVEVIGNKVQHQYLTIRDEICALRCWTFSFRHQIPDGLQATTELYSGQEMAEKLGPKLRRRPKCPCRASDLLTACTDGQSEVMQNRRRLKANPPTW